MISGNFRSRKLFRYLGLSMITYHFILFQMRLKLVASLVFMGSVALLLSCTNIFRDDPIPADQSPNDCWSLFIKNLKVAFLLCQKYSRVRKKFRAIMISFNILRLVTRNRYFWVALLFWPQLTVTLRAGHSLAKEVLNWLPGYKTLLDRKWTGNEIFKIS